MRRPVVDVFWVLVVMAVWAVTGYQAARRAFWRSALHLVALGARRLDRR